MSRATKRIMLKPLDRTAFKPFATRRSLLVALAAVVAGLFPATTSEATHTFNFVKIAEGRIESQSNLQPDEPLWVQEGCNGSLPNGYLEGKTAGAIKGQNFASILKVSGLNHLNRTLEFRLGTVEFPPAPANRPPNLNVVARTACGITGGINHGIDPKEQFKVTGIHHLTFTFYGPGVRGVSYSVYRMDPKPH